VAEELEVATRTRPEDSRLLAGARARERVAARIAPEAVIQVSRQRVGQLLGVMAREAKQVEKPARVASLPNAVARAGNRSV
jgi:hypothetical protein